MISTYQIPKKKMQIENKEILHITEEYELKDAIHSKQLNTIKVLSFKNSNINDQTLSILWTFTEPLPLLKINLAENFSFVTDAGIEHLCQCQNLVNLKILNLADNAITDEGVSRICKTHFLRKIQKLILYGNTDITSESLNYLATSEIIRSLKHLDVHATSICDEGLRVFLKSQNSSQLVHLNLSMNWKRVTDITLKSIAKLKSCSKLKELHLEDCSISDDGMYFLCDSQNSSELEVLNLNNSINIPQKNNIISDQTLISLTQSNHMIKLKTLELRNTDISSEGVKSLSASLCLQNLEVFRISHCEYIKDEALYHLESIIGYGNLRKIYINSTSVGKDAFQKMQSKYPNINIIY